MQKVLITGGTGFIGVPLCKALTVKGWQVTLLRRNETPNPKDTYDAIINLAGEPVAQRWTTRAKERITNSRIETTRKLIDYMARTAERPRVFISGSAIGYYGTHDSASFTETSIPSNNAIGSFAKDLCQQWETAALQAKAFGIRTVLLRLGAVLEKDGGMLKKLYPSFFMGAGGMVGHGRQWFSWVHRDDVIGFILFALENAKLEGAYNLTAPQPVTNAEFTKALGAALHRPTLFTVPAAALHLAFADMADELMLNGQKVIPERALQSGYKFLFNSIGQALQKIYQ